MRDHVTSDLQKSHKNATNCINKEKQSRIYVCRSIHKTNHPKNQALYYCVYAVLGGGMGIRYLTIRFGWGGGVEERVGEVKGGLTVIVN